MKIDEKLLEARNALTLCESLLLEAYILSPHHVAEGIRLLLVSLASDRDTIAGLHQLALQFPEPPTRRKPLLRARDLLDS